MGSLSSRHDPHTLSLKGRLCVLAAGTREGYHLTQSSIRTCVREGTSVYMDKLEGTNSYADMLEAIRRPGNGAVADRLTKVFVREMVTSYFQKPQQEGNAIHIR